MAIEYSWSIEDLKTTDATVSGVAYTDAVSEVHWRLNASERVDGDIYTATEYGSLSLNLDDIDADTFIEFADLGGLTIVGWAVELINRDDAEAVDAMKTRLAATIAAAKNPPVKKMPTETVFDDALLGA